MKKAKLTSKCGKKVEIYYLSDHPANKMTVTENASLEVEGAISYFHPDKVKSASFSVFPKKQSATSTSAPNKGITIELPPKGTKDAYAMGWSLEQGLLANTFSLDDSIKSDLATELIVNKIYKIKGLNIVARLEGLRLQKLGLNQLYRFSFHGFEFFVEPNMILNANDFETNKYKSIEGH